MSAYVRTCAPTVKELETALAEKLDADILYFNAPIAEDIFPPFRELLEKLAEQSDKRESLAIFLTTYGGSAEIAEKIVELAHSHYGAVYFVVPDYALSAGTIMCMAGDKIYMDYSSSLGPIDPQVADREGKKFVPALGYLDKINEFIEKSGKGVLTPLEYDWAIREDIGVLRTYEQARELSVSLLKKWLVKYKFKNGILNGSRDKGRKTALAEKEERAKEIGERLSDHKIWHSHARRISLETLERECKLEIDNFGEDKEIQGQIRLYANLLAREDSLAQRGFLICSAKFEQREGA